jgi:ribosomal protein S18 acetylase RimI-like enzyme
MTTASASGPRSFLARSIETDRDYFELGARLERLPGAVLAWMPGLASAAPGAVIQRVEEATVAEGAEQWLSRAEQALSDVGAAIARIYLERPNERIDGSFRKAGYVDREELIFANSFGPPAPGLEVRLVENDSDWDRKLRLHELISTPPDGHQTSASDWVALERRKCEAGMEAYLVERDGETVGAIGALRGEGVLRLKNIVVHPAHRRRGVGLAMLGHLGMIASSRGISDQIVFAVRGEIGELLYRAAGMREIGSVVEWSKPLGVSRK